MSIGGTRRKRSSGASVGELRDKLLSLTSAIVGHRGGYPLWDAAASIRNRVASSPRVNSTPKGTLPDDVSPFSVHYIQHMFTCSSQCSGLFEWLAFSSRGRATRLSGLEGDAPLAACGAWDGMGCATTSRRFEREMLFTPRSTLRENFTVVPLDVKKDRTPHTSAKRRPAAQVDLHKHRSCRLWLQPAQRTDSPTTHASPRTTRSAKRASPRNAARKGAVHVHDGLPPLRHRRPDRLRPCESRVPARRRVW